jgi:acyl-CoA synthetase (AMP-forming)/AMP-acid ligase II
VGADLAWRSTPELVSVAAERFGDAEALVDGDVRLSFRDLAAAVRRAAKGFVAAGVAPGDRVGIWAPNVGEWVAAALGVHAAGAVLVPVNTRFKGEEAAWVLGRSGARVVLTITGFLGTDYVGMLQAIDGVEQVVVLRADAPAGTTAWDDFLAAGDGVDDAEVDRRSAAVGADDTSDVIFTSGTTGRPKGVVTTHGQTLRAFDDWSRIVGLREGDRYLVVNPFFHTFGYKAGFLACLMRGATIVPHAVFDVPSVLARVAEERISMIPGPPTLYASILDAPDRASLDLSSLRLAVTGAAPVPVPLIERMRDELTFETVLTAYGLTEATGVVTICRQDDDPETISRTSGRAIPEVEVRIVDDSGAEVDRGAPGEIVVRGYNVMQGYFEDPEATAEAIDEQGWLHTGDIGVMDDRGNVTITDRKKDMFVVGGFNAYPAEIEGTLLRHPAVGQVAVVGVPDERMGEVGMAFVIPRPGATVDGDELVAWARERMANYKVPRRVAVVEALPLNASGKVLKHELRASAAKS